MPRQKVIFVTGASGLIGKAVVKNLLKNDYQVNALLRQGTLSPFLPEKNLHIVHGSMEDQGSLVKGLRNCLAVVNLAANQYHPTLSYRVNVLGTKNLIEAMEESGVKRLIHISTLATRLAHKGVYGKTKSQADELVKASNLDWTIFKPSLVYGEDPKTIFTTIAGFVKSLPFVPVLGEGTQPFRPVWAEDVAEAITKSIKIPRTIKNEFDLGSKESISFNQLVKKIQKTLGKEKQPIAHVPYLLSLMGALVLREVMKDPPITVDNVLGSNQPTNCRPEKAFQVLKWKPIGVDEGIQKVLTGGEKVRLPVAIVGLGKMGTLHGAILSTFPDVKITALVDSDPKLGKTILSMGVAGHFYTSLQEALNYEEVNAVFITTPTFAHKEIIEICLKRKLPFFVEKPVFPRWHNYQELGKQTISDSEISFEKFSDGPPTSPSGFRRAGKHTSVVTATGYFYSFRRPYVLAQKLISKGIIGKLKSFQAKLLISEVFKEKHGWIFKKELSGGGVLMNPGPHVFGVLEKFFGSPSSVLTKTKRIYSREVEDEAKVQLGYKNGLKGEIFASWSVKGIPLTSVSVAIRGQNGTIFVDEEKVVFSLAKAKAGFKKGKTTILISQIEKPGGEKPTFVLSPAAGGEGYTLEDRAFIDAVRSKKAHLNNLEFAARVEKTIALCYKSAEQGKEMSRKLDQFV